MLPTVRRFLVWQKIQDATYYPDQVDLFLDPAQPRGATRALFEQLRDGILSGRFAAGDRITPSRELAAQLGVSRQTVTTVYARLAAEGFIEGRAGGGSYVAHVGGERQRVAEPAVLSARPPFSNNYQRPAEHAVPVRYDLRPATPDPKLFPLADWRRSVVASLQTPMGGYGDPAGVLELRRALTRWVARSRSIATTPEQMFVTAGAQQAIDLIVRLLVRPGDTVAIEEPGYVAARLLCQSVGAEVAPVPVDADGIVVDAIPSRARVIYTTPSHQSPTGATLSLPRRRALLAFAERHGIAVIEDDYDSEYRHDDRPLEPLHTLDRSGRVVYVGTFSKTLSPALRLGFAVMPASLVPAALQARELMDWQAPTINQQAMVRFIGDGHLERHLRRSRKVYRERHRLVVDFVRRQAERGRLHEIATNHAGLHVVAHLPPGGDEADVRERARQQGVAIGNYRAAWASADPPPGISIGFGTIDTASLPEALSILEAVLDRSG
jgi:GntR family transcriptional regulator/MocR family aminotransferase